MAFWAQDGAGGVGNAGRWKRSVIVEGLKDCFDWGRVIFLVEALVGGRFSVF